jgi:hypothetical protein
VFAGPCLAAFADVLAGNLAVGDTLLHHCFFWLRAVIDVVWVPVSTAAAFRKSNVFRTVQIINADESRRAKMQSCIVFKGGPETAENNLD